MLPLIGVADLEPGDLVGVADAPFLRIPLVPCNTPPRLRDPTLVRLWTARYLLSCARLTRRG